MKQPAVYMMSNRKNGVLYLGVTSNLIQRAYQHRQHIAKGFTDRYNLESLVWYELHETMESAIQREHTMKHWRRQWKIDLIENTNPEWRDLWQEIVG